MGTLRSTLYRNAGRLVILPIIVLYLAPGLRGQIARAPQSSKGPRAVGLIQLTPDGKATMIPITILIDGQYFDAGAYKASPVPMALWSETVYEGVQTGVSKGLFTVTGGLQNEVTHQWIGAGNWVPAGAVNAKSGKEKASTEPRGLNDDAGPPVLRHSGPAKPKAPEATPASAPPAPPAPPTPQTPPTPTPAAPAPAPASPPTPPEPASPPAASQADAGPMLKRGKPAPKEPEPFEAPAIPPKRAAHSLSSAPGVQLIPAISDAGGPDPRPYAYAMKPEEEQQFRKKMLEMASDTVRARAKENASRTIGGPEPPAKSAQKKSAAKPAQPAFDDIRFHVFDLSNSNEPILVLTAKAKMPATDRQGAAPDLQYLVALVARQDVNADYHKAFSSVTDTQHLDVMPQMEFIDAVDVDGDGRGELLFRRVSDTGSAFIIYRVIGDQLYALFEGTP